VASLARWSAAIRFFCVAAQSPTVFVTVSGGLPFLHGGFNAVQGTLVPMLVFNFSRNDSCHAVKALREQFHHGLHAILEQYRQHDHVAGWPFNKLTNRDPCVRNVRESTAALSAEHGPPKPAPVLICCRWPSWTVWRKLRKQRHVPGPFGFPSGRSRLLRVDQRPSSDSNMRPPWS